MTDQTTAAPDAVLATEAAPRVPENRFHRFAHIDALRAFAVLLVVVMHAGITVSPGDSGVTIFFTISGFIITTLLVGEWRRSRTFDVARFYRRRALKLAPPFVVAILIPSVIWALVIPDPPLLGIVSQVLFSYNWVMVLAPAESGGLPGSGVLWSLGVEEQFYIAFAIVWLLALRTRRPLLTTGIVATSAIAVSHALRLYYLLEAFPRDYALRGTPARMDAIAWGVLLAIGVAAMADGRAQWLKRFANDRVLACAVLAFPVLALVQADWWEKLVRPGAYPLVACVVILYGTAAPDGAVRRVFDRLCANRVVTAIGLSSYSIYIVHGVLLALVVLLFPQLEALPLAVRVPLLVVVGTAAGYAVFRIVELPVLALRRRHGW